MQWMIAFREPYSVGEPRATLDADLARVVGTRAGASRAGTVDEAIITALDLAD